MKYVIVGHRSVGVRAEVDAETIQDAESKARELWRDNGWPSVQGVAIFPPMETDGMDEDVRERGSGHRDGKETQNG